MSFAAARRLKLTRKNISVGFFNEKFAVVTNVGVYFRDPKIPLQQFRSQLIDGVLHQYFARGTYLFSNAKHEVNRLALRNNKN